MSYRNMYLKAAEQVDKGHDQYSCNAIKRCNLTKGPSAMEFYRRVMWPEQPIVGGACDWFLEELMDVCFFEGIDETKFRVLLLCMMAACCDDMEGV